MAKSTDKKGMFYGLMDFAMQRTSRQAVGFYLFYLVIIMIIGAIVGGTIGGYSGFSNPSDTSASLSVAVAAQVMSVVYVISLVYLIAIGALVLVKKRLFTDPISIFMFLLGIVLTMVIGNLVGLVPVAYLTTKDTE